MNRVLPVLSRWLSWLSTDHLAVGVSAYYGGFIWCFHSFAVSTSFRALTTDIAPQGVPPESIFAVPLLVGAVIHGLGIRRRSDPWMMWGTLLSFAVFAAAAISCAMTALNSTGVPAYFGYCAAYALLALRHATGNQWIPLA